MNKFNNQQGVTLFALIYGDVPFKNQAIPKLYEQIQSDDVSFPAKITISDDLRDFITKLLDKDPERRLNMQQIKVSNKISTNNLMFHVGFMWCK